METLLKSIPALFATLIAFLWGEWSILLGVLVTLVILDYITGLICAWKDGEISSKVGLIGIAKKAFIFVIVAVGNLVDVVLIETGISDTPLVFIAVVVFYIANELISITENAGKMNVPFPQQLLNAIKILKGKEEGK